MRAQEPRLVDWTATARYYEYTSAADPSVPEIPFAVFPASLHCPGASRVVPLDLSHRLATDAPATSPALLANFLVLAAGEPLRPRAHAGSQTSGRAAGRERG